MSLITSMINKVVLQKGKKALSDIEKNSKSPRESNERLLFQILNDNKDTEYGQKYRFREIKSIEEYRKKVPYSNYNTYASYIKRMLNNKEKNLITAYQIIYYVQTSGTVGTQKIIPITNKSMNIWEKYFFCKINAMAARYYKQHKKEVFAKKMLNMFEMDITAIESDVPIGFMSSAVFKQFRWTLPIMTSPKPIFFPSEVMNMNYMKARFALEEPHVTSIMCVFFSNIVYMMNYIKANWQMIVDDIENGTLNDNVCEKNSREIIMPYIKKNPKRAKELQKIFEEGFDTPIIPKIWPEISWISSIGTGDFAIYTNEFKKYAGKNVDIDYSAYCASEGIFAVCINMNDPHFMLLPDSCFFEFLPTDVPENDNNTLLLDQLKEGQEYEIIITNLSGFYRYKMNDVIRVVGFHNDCPIITFSYRKGQLINIDGEHSTQECLDEVVRRLGKELHCVFNDYAVYMDYSADISRYVMLLEPNRPIAIDKDGSYGEKLEKILSEVNHTYAIVSKIGNLGKPLVLIQQQQTHALWRELKIMNGASSNQVKTVRVLDIPAKQKFFFELLEANQESGIKNIQETIKKL